MARWTMAGTAKRTPSWALIAWGEGEGRGGEGRGGEGRGGEGRGGEERGGEEREGEGRGEEGRGGEKDFARKKIVQVGIIYLYMFTQQYCLRKITSYKFIFGGEV